jgi:hypothetical protein
MQDMESMAAKMAAKWYEFPVVFVWAGIVLWACLVPKGDDYEAC